MSKSITYTHSDGTVVEYRDNFPAPLTAQAKRDLADEIANRFGCEFQPTGERGMVALMVRPHAQGQMVSPIDACVAELTRRHVLPANLIVGGS